MKAKATEKCVAGDDHPLSNEQSRGRADYSRWSTDDSPMLSGKCQAVE